MMQTISHTPQNILVIQQRQLGDVTVTTPVFEAVKTRFPHARLAFLTEEKCVPLVLHDPYLDEILTFPKDKGFFEKLAFYVDLLKRKFDVVADLQQLPRCQTATLFSFARYRLSFAPRHWYRKLLYNYCEVPENTEEYTSYTKTRILSPLGVVPTENKPRIYLLDEERARGKEILQQLGITEYTKFITLDATHKHPRRRWKYYRELVQEILSHYPDFKFFVIRARGEDDQVAHLLEIDRERVVMPQKPLSLRESMACMSFASYHIGNTSAPAHMALALNIPALVILAETGKFWHFDPKNPPRGTARQLEVRLSDKDYQAYLVDLQKFRAGELADFTEIEYPLINCITVEKALEKFSQLTDSPYYH